MDSDDSKVAAKDKRLKGLGWRLAELDYFRHPHEAVSGLIFGALALFALWLIYVFASAMWTLIAGLADPKAASENAKNLLLTVGASVAAPFVVWRTWIAHQQWQVGEAQAKTQIETMQTGLLTKAIEQLGAMREEKIAFRSDDGKWETRTETVPNIEVRLGAIYLLKRLAEDNDRDHGPILETLCAYVRENSRQEWKRWSREEAKRRGVAATSGEDVVLIEPMTSDVIDAFAEGDHSKTLEWLTNKPLLREDIQSALRVIGDRNLANRRRLFEIKPDLSLAGSFLVGAQLQNTTLRHVNFSATRCQGADFSSSELLDVNFSRAHLQGANFSGSRSENSIFDKASCQSAIFEMANLRQTSFIFSNLHSASFIESYCQLSNFSHSKCPNTEFSLAKLQGSIFRNADCNDTSFAEANLDSVEFDSTDLSNAHGLSTRMLAGAFGNERTKLPETVERPPPGLNWYSGEHVTPRSQRERRVFIEEKKKKIPAEIDSDDWFGQFLA